MRKASASALFLAALTVPVLASADDATPSYHKKTWTEVISRIPCQAFRHNPDRSWTLIGKLTVDEAEQSYTDLTFTQVPPQDNGAKILDLRCGSGQAD